MAHDRDITHHQEGKLKAIDRLLRFAIPADSHGEVRHELTELAGLSNNNYVDWVICNMKDIKDTRRSFICHPLFNYDINIKAYRHPGTNEYYIINDGIALSVDGSLLSSIASTPLQELEALLDRLTANYVMQYHGPSAISSLYLKETQYGFCGVFLVKNEGVNGDTWQSEQFIELAMAAGRPDIRIDGKVIACMTERLPLDGGDFRITAEARRKTRNISSDFTSMQQSGAGWLVPTLTQETQVKAIGELLEENENYLRRQIEDVYMQKIKEIVDNLHSLDEAYVSKETATAIRDIRPMPGMTPHPLFAGELANVLKGRKRIDFELQGSTLNNSTSIYQRMKGGYAEVEHVLRSCSSIRESRDALRRLDANLDLIDCKYSGDLADVIAEHNTACTINPSRSAAILLRNFYSNVEIEQIAKKILADCITDPHTTNLDPLTTPEQRAQMVEEYEHMCSSNVSELNTCLLRKLRWSSLGVHYDWTRRTYRGTSTSDMPQWVCDLYQGALKAADDVSGSSLSKGDYQPQAALVNFFHGHRSSDRLGGHKDDVEARDQSPLVILALGLPCVFLLGGDTKTDITPAPILFNSGDVLVLSKEARQWIHGVPTILKSSTDRPHHPDGSVADFLNRTRLSISIREVWGDREARNITKKVKVETTSVDDTVDQP